MKIYKIYGKAEMLTDMTADSIKLIEKTKDIDDLLIFVDINTSEGYAEALSKNIYYLPAVTCEDGNTGDEIGYLENSSNMNENNVLVNLWWDELKSFIQGMNE